MGGSIDIQNTAFGHIDAGSGPLSGISDYPFSLAVWCQIDVVAFTSDVIFGITDAGSLSGAGSNFWTIQSADFGGDLHFRCNIKASEGSSFIGAWDTNVALPDPTWYHIAFVCAASDDFKLYANGVERASSSTTRSFSSCDAMGSGVQSQRLSSGSVAWAQLYDSALTTDNLAEIIANPESLPYNLIWNIGGAQGAYGSTDANYLDHAPDQFGVNVFAGSPSGDNLGPPIHFCGVL